MYLMMGMCTFEDAFEDAVSLRACIVHFRISAISKERQVLTVVLCTRPQQEEDFFWALGIVDSRSFSSELARP